MSIIPRRQHELSGDQMYNKSFEDAVRAAEQHMDAVDRMGSKRTSVAVITAAVTGALAVLGAAADGLETLAPSEIDWLLTTALVVFVSAGLVLFVISRISRLSADETAHLRKALNQMVNAAREQLNRYPPAG